MKAATPYPVPRSSRGRTFGALLIGVGVLELLVLAGIHGATLWRMRLPEIRTGDVAPETVVTPVALSVEDATSTRRLREQESRRVPPVFEFDSQSSERVANRFLEKFDSKQIQFVRQLQKKWELPLDQEILDSEEFANVLIAFRIAHSDFPLSDDMAAQWAGDEPDSGVRLETSHQIREQQRRYIVSNAPPPESASNHPEFWLLPKDADSGSLSLEEVERRAHVLTAESVLSIADAGSALVESLADFQDEWKDFAVEFLEPNLFFAGELTASTRREATGALIVRKEFEAGENVVVAGRPVSETQSAALEKLAGHYAALKAERRFANGWLVALGAGCLLAGIVVRNVNRRPVVSGLVVSDRLEHDPLRSGLINQMSRWLKDQFVVRLIDQRNEAVDSQAGASLKVDQINMRLNKLQPEIREKIETYERRIEDLEKELGESTAMNKELLRSKISAAKKELEDEKARSNVAWN